jgi:hypothetical protein
MHVCVKLTGNLPTNGKRHACVREAGGKQNISTNGKLHACIREAEGEFVFALGETCVVERRCVALDLLVQEHRVGRPVIRLVPKAAPQRDQDVCSAGINGFILWW